jgi:phosphate transport system ATP-binding protein
MKRLFSAIFPKTELRTKYRTADASGEKQKRLFRPDYKFIRNEQASELSVERLTVYIKYAHILKDVSFTIPAKKITCIIGPSGCGKTTLLKTLNRLTDSVDGVKINGKVLVNGDDIINSGAEITRIRRKMGLISQRPCPLPMSIYDNVAYGCRIHGISNRRKLRMVVKHYLDAAGLWDEVKDRLRTPAVRLSIGQQQRLCLARSLAVEPQFILADEATSALDPFSSKIIEELFIKLKQDYAIVMVTHTLRQALRIADYVIFMYLGEIIEMGCAEQIFKNPQHELTKKYLSGAFS